MREMIRLGLASLPIAINRSALQVASIIITAILGQMDQLLLAQFSLTLAAASLLFSLTTSVQLGVQGEFARAAAQEDYRHLSKLFWATIVIVTLLAGVLAALFLLVFPPFTGITEENLATGAQCAFKLLLISLPLVAWTTALGHLLESFKEARLVAKTRLGQITIQVALVTATALGWIDPASALSPVEKIMVMYILSDVIMLLGLTVIGFRAGVLRKIHLLAPDFSSILASIRLGFPVTFGLCGQRYVLYILTLSIAALGSTFAAAFAILNSVMFFLQIPLLGWSHATTIEIGQTRGGRLPTDLPSLLKTAFLGASMITLSTTLFLYVAENPILSLFTQDPDVASSFSSLGLALYAFILLGGFITFITSALRGYGDTMVPQATLVTALLLGYVGLHSILEFELTFADEIWLFVSAGALGAIALTARLLSKNSTESYGIGA